MMKPKVSVIIPVYNVEAYLEKCIESVRNQTFKDIEIIAVNDGSTDGSRKLLDKLKGQDERILIVDKPNGGLSSARNAGIDIARGEYLVFVDSDDWVDADYIKKMYNVCVNYNCDIVQCSYIDVYDYQFNIASKEDCSDGFPTFYTGREFSYAMYTLLSWRCNLAWNKLYKKSLFENIRFPHGKIHEDEFTTYKLIWNANKVGVISDKLYYYRHREGSIMSQPYGKKRLNASEAFVEREHFYESKGELELLYLEKKRHLVWCLKQRPLVINIKDGTEKESVMTYLDNKEMDLLQEIECLEDKVKAQSIGGVVFPFGKVSKGSSIILYGGGSVGRHYYRQVYSQNYCKIILWIDKNVNKCKEQGIPVEAVEQISCCESKWDYIVIAIEDMQIVSEIIKILIEDYNVPADKIIYDFFR